MSSNVIINDNINKTVNIAPAIFSATINTAAIATVINETMTIGFE